VSVAVWPHVASVHGDVAIDRAILDEVERGRAERFRFERDRRRYIERHAFVRRVLAMYLDCDPAEVAIRVDPRGKPSVDSGTAPSFNLSHDDDLSVLVVGDGRPVGVDVERIRTIDQVQELAEGLFTPDEVAVVQAPDPVASSLVFLSLWTRKEAVLKAMGVGLSGPLDGFTVLTGDGSAVGRPRHAGGELAYAFAALDGMPGYVGAVACAGERLSLTWMDQEGLG
jgi:4'-phosphopantetheinyl transferase